MRVMKAHDTQPSSSLVCFCEVVARDPFYLVGRHDRPRFRLAGLARLRFATVSEVPTPWMCLQNDLREQGIDPSRLARAPDRPMAANFEALCNGELGVVQLFDLPIHGFPAGRRAHSLCGERARTDSLYDVHSHEGCNQAPPRRVCRYNARHSAHAGLLAQHSPEELAEITAPYFPDIARNIFVSSLRRYGRVDGRAQALRPVCVGSGAYGCHGRAQAPSHAEDDVLRQFRQTSSSCR
jgi:NitT/TauT family transport system substrate-binding protein